MNTINVISPYWLDDVNTWVFDDERFGIIQEPFVQGVPAIINAVVKDIPNAKDGFRLLFSNFPFPEYDLILKYDDEEYGGWWYTAHGMKGKGWLCAAAQNYFDGPPAEIFVKVEEI
jgi:hypothetical protein